MTSVRRKKLGFVVASPMTADVFLRPHLEKLADLYDITIYLPLAPGSKLELAGGRVRVVDVDIRRNIAPLADLAALFALYRHLRREDFALVFSQTPKAGLLASLAGFAAWVPRRVHCFTGQVWATKRGFARWLLKSLDQLVGAAVTHVLADSGSQRDFLLSHGIGRRTGITVLADGSISGVDTGRFVPDAAARVRVRERLGIPPDATVFLFIGRLNREKGIPELAIAFSRLASRRPDCWLVLTGPDEGNMAGPVLDLAGSARGRVRITGSTQVPEEFMAAADVLCLPSHREGFGSVVIEAAACGVPAIGSAIYGVSDAIVDGETGLLFPVTNDAALEGQMERLAADPALRRSLGDRARQRAVDKFSGSVVVAAMVDYLAMRISEIER